MRLEEFNDNHELKHWLLDQKFGTPVAKDGCGVFGILRKRDRKKISSLLAIRGISSAKYRGSELGAGYACFHLPDKSEGASPHRIMAFVQDERAGMEIENELLAIGSLEEKSLGTQENHPGQMKVWEAFLVRREDVSDRQLEERIDKINRALISESGSIRGRIFSYGRHVSVYKEVGYPLEVAGIYHLNDESSQEADMWIAHTRQPTNSPGSLPVWSHPFASMDCAIVHNGDISSFGANVELLKSWGIESHIGTDSEVIAKLLDRLIREEKLEILEAGRILTNPFTRNVTNQATIEVMNKYDGARLDGPFAVIAGYCDGHDCYLIALTDRSKFRPLLIGEDENCYYVASEESQIRLLSPTAITWTPEPGSVFIASLKNGLIESGTRRNIKLQESVLRTAPQEDDEGRTSSLEAITAADLDFKKINSMIAQAYKEGRPSIEFSGLAGQRYVGIGFSSRITAPRSQQSSFRISLRGFPGNCLANLNDGGVFEIFGNVADDVADTMHSGSIVVHGNARDVLGQALQGGSILVRGSVGNRAAIQMREYKNNRPFIIIGETADDYLGEYMAGGVVCVLNLSNSDHPIGNYVGTGMVGGRIYVRGLVQYSQIGLPPQREDVLKYLNAAKLDGRITQELFDQISRSEFPGRETLMGILPTDLFERVDFLFFSNRYSKPPSTNRRKLSGSDIEQLDSALREFFRAFSVPEPKIKEIMESEYTVIEPLGEIREPVRPIPPQEMPVEE